MANESYYFLFSIAAVVIAMLQIVNMVCFKVKGRTILGEEVKLGKLGYEKFRKFSSIPGLVITSIVTLGFIANLAYSVNRILSLGKPGYAHGILIYAPIIFIIFFVVMFFVTRNKLKLNKHD